MLGLIGLLLFIAALVFGVRACSGKPHFLIHQVLYAFGFLIVAGMMQYTFDSGGTGFTLLTMIPAVILIILAALEASKNK